MEHVSNRSNCWYYENNEINDEIDDEIDDETDENY